ncbi:MAG: helix-turn-helix transcriptional regulator, partial [Candidatus Saccharibacteria bacterium]
MNMYIALFGEQIKLARLHRGLTQQKLVDLLNDELEGEEIVERSIISRWENSRNFPRNNRREILEKLLNINLGDAPPRRDTFSAYLTSQDEMNNSIQLGLHNCSEVWMTNILEPRSIWRELPESHDLLQSLRDNPACYFREIIYIRTIEDIN